MRMILLAFYCLLVLNACQKEINGDLPDNEEIITTTFIDCDCRLVNVREDDGFNRAEYFLSYEGGKVNVSIEMVNAPPAILMDDPGNPVQILTLPPADYEFILWEPEPVSFTYNQKGVLLLVAATEKSLAFEYSISGVLRKIRRFNAGSPNGWTPPYRYYKPTFDAQGNIVQLKEFDMAGHQAGTISITYSDVPNTLSSLSPFNFEKNLTMHSHFPLITYFVHKSKYLVKSVVVNDEPPIEWNYDLDASPKEITISTGDGNVRKFYYECE